MGASTLTDSRTPRRLSRTSSTMAAPSAGTFQARQRGRQEAPDGLASGGDGHRDGEDVVDEQRGPGDEPGPRAQEPGRHHVPAAAEGEVLDDPRVGERDEQHRPGRRERQRRGQEVQVADGPVELVGTVRRGGEAVRAQPHPGEQRDERDVVVGPRVVDVPGGAEEHAAKATARRPGCLGRDRRIRIRRLRDRFWCFQVRIPPPRRASPPAEVKIGVPASTPAQEPAGGASRTRQDGPTRGTPPVRLIPSLRGWAHAWHRPDRVRASVGREGRRTSPSLGRSDGDAARRGAGSAPRPRGPRPLASVGTRRRHGGLRLRAPAAVPLIVVEPSRNRHR